MARASRRCGGAARSRASLDGCRDRPMAGRSARGVGGRHDESVRRGRRLARTKQKPHHADQRMTSTRDFTASVGEQREELERLRAEVAEWRRRFAKGELRDIAFTNSANDVEPLYTAMDVDPQTAENLGVPGTYALTRSIHPTGYRGKLWTMRQFAGIPLDEVSTSMTINGPAIIVWAFYIAAAEKQGVSSDKLRGTIQNDILKEYMAQHAWCFPIEPALRLIVDCFEWGAKHAPLWNTISISGYHIREAGSTAAQELAFTLADGFTYVERGIARGLDVDDFAPRLSFFWDIHNDFFEEIAKLRAARRIWARHMKERYHAKSPRSLLMRFHSQTAGVTRTTLFIGCCAVSVT